MAADSQGNYRAFPANIQWDYSGGFDRPLSREALDSIVAFADTLHGFPWFCRNVPLIAMEQKHVPDIISAYDGDTNAFARLASAISSPSMEESDFVTDALGKIDRLRTIYALAHAVQFESNGFHRDHLLRELKWQRDRYDERHYPPRLSDFERQINAVTDDEIERVISARKIDELVLEAAMKRGNAEYHRRARELVLSVFDSLVNSNENEASHLASMLLTVPAPGDTINDSVDVKEIFIGVLSHSISGNPYREDNPPNRFSADTLRFLANARVILVEPKLNYLEGIPAGHFAIMAVTDSEIVSWSNRNGSVCYARYTPRIYHGFASVGLSSFMAFPVWGSRINGGSAYWWTLRKLNGSWRIIGRPGVIVS